MITTCEHITKTAVWFSYRYSAITSASASSEGLGDNNDYSETNLFIKHNVLLLLFTAIEFSLGGSRPYTSNK